jgi:hypothetical protein
MGSQKLTSRHPSTASVAAAAGTPQPTRRDVVDASMMPSPPGTPGAAASTFPMP